MLIIRDFNIYNSKLYITNISFITFFDLCYGDKFCSNNSLTVIIFFIMFYTCGSTFTFSLLSLFNTPSVSFFLSSILF